MMESNDKQVMPSASFAGLGGGKIAYIRSLNASEAKGLFPGLPEVAPDLQLWALLAADGTPIMLSDSREAALMNARENDLEAVSIH
jgi:hypothetical protein